MLHGQTTILQGIIACSISPWNTVVQPHKTNFFCLWHRNYTFTIIHYSVTSCNNIWTLKIAFGIKKLRYCRFSYFTATWWTGQRFMHIKVHTPCGLCTNAIVISLKSQIPQVAPPPPLYTTGTPRSQVSILFQWSSQFGNG